MGMSSEGECWKKAFLILGLVLGLMSQQCQSTLQMTCPLCSHHHSLLWVWFPSTSILIIWIQILTQPTRERQGIRGYSNIRRSLECHLFLLSEKDQSSELRVKRQS